MKTLLFFSFLSVFAINRSMAQENWGGGVDGEQLHFGFTFQYVASEFKILKFKEWKGPFPDPYHPGDYLINSELKSITSPVKPGFGLGFVSDFRMGNNANLRFTPGMVFADRVVNYEFADPSFNDERIVKTSLVELPLGVKLKSDRRKNFRAYLIAGGKYSIDITSNKKTSNVGLDPEAMNLQNIKNTLWYEAGFGFDLYFDYFKMSPEIKFAQSFKSVLRDDGSMENPYSLPIDKLFIRNFQFSLYFE